MASVYQSFLSFLALLDVCFFISLFWKDGRMLVFMVQLCYSPEKPMALDAQRSSNHGWSWMYGIMFNCKPWPNGTALRSGNRRDLLGVSSMPIEFGAIDHFWIGYLTILWLRGVQRVEWLVVSSSNPSGVISKMTNTCGWSCPPLWSWIPSYCYQIINQENTANGHQMAMKWPWESLDSGGLPWLSFITQDF